MTNSNVKNVAIAGASGSLGKSILAALLAKGNSVFNITAISRADSAATFPDAVTVRKGDYDDDQFLQTALAGQDVLVLALGFMIPADLPSRFIAAAAAGGVSWILPTEFGSDGAHERIGKEIPMHATRPRYREEIERTGTSSWIAVVNNPWFDWSMAQGLFGIDIQKRTATLYDQGNVKFNTTTLATVGRAVAGLLALPVESEKSGSPSLSDYKNKFAYVRSFHVTQRELLQAVQEVTGTKDEDWTITDGDAQTWIDEGRQRMANGDIYGGFNVLYGYHLKEGLGGDYEHTRPLVNDTVGLPKDDLVEETKKVVDKLS